MGDFKRHTPGVGLLGVQADARDLGGHKSGAGQVPVVGGKSLEAAKQRVDGGVPGLVRGGVGELVGPGHVPCGVNGGKHGLQIGVGGHGVLSGNAQGLQAIALQARAPPHGAHQQVEGQRVLQAAALVMQHQ